MTADAKPEIRAAQANGAEAGALALGNGDEPESDLPAGLGKPAQRALAAAGYSRLDRLTEVAEAELLKLHGMGPKALDQLRRALAGTGRAFADARSRAG